MSIGITEIGLVINHAQEKLIKEAVGYGERFGAKLNYIYQIEPQGIADAVRVAEDFIARESFVLLLGDNLIEEPLTCLKDSMEKKGVHGSIMLAKVKNPTDYGIAEIKEGKIIGLVEKPTHPKSDLAVIGAYAFDATIFKAVQAISPSARGEYEITDAIQWLIDQGYLISAHITRKNYSDVGNVRRWLEANQWMLESIAGNKLICTGQPQLENCIFIPPVIISGDCQLIDSTIGPYVSIASGVKVKSAHIEHSILLKGASVEKIPTKISSSVFGQYSEVYGALNLRTDQESVHAHYILGDKSSILNGFYEETEQRKDTE